MNSGESRLSLEESKPDCRAEAVERISDWVASHGSA